MTQTGRDYSRLVLKLQQTFESPGRLNRTQFTGLLGVSDSAGVGYSLHVLFLTSSQVILKGLLLFWDSHFCKLPSERFHLHDTLMVEIILTCRTENYITFVIFFISFKTTSDSIKMSFGFRHLKSVSLSSVMSKIKPCPSSRASSNFHVNDQNYGLFSQYQKPFAHIF